MSHEKCDVVVIGGGPGGSLSATFLALRGYKVILLEKQSHPRNTVGESLIPDVWNHTGAAGVTERLEAEGFLRKAGATVNWHGKTFQLSFSDFGATRTSLHVERDRWDLILLDRARELGVSVRERVAADRADFSGWPDVVRVDCRDLTAGERGVIDCRMVIDATGQDTLLGAQYGMREIDQSFRFAAVWGYFLNSNYVGGDGLVHPASMARDIPPTTCVSALPIDENGFGWSWHILLRESTSVGLIVPVDILKQVRAGKESLEAWFLRVCEQLPISGELLRNATLIPGSMRLLRDYSYRMRKSAGPGFLLVGDAGGFIDPIFSVGVPLAMYGARIAAHTVDRCLRKRDRAAHYSAIYDDQWQGRIDLARRLALPMHVPDAEVEESLKRVMAWQGSDALKLMSAHTQLIGRGANFTSLMAGEEIPAAARERFRKLDMAKLGSSKE